jgi:GT2 family glycosyltransferase
MSREIPFKPDVPDSKSGIPQVDVFVVLYNSERFITPLIESLRRVKLPIVCHFLDNASRDGTLAVLLKALETTPFKSHVLRSLNNNGFARGVNLLSALASTEFIFVLNPDTIVEEGCIEALVERAAADATIGMCEARQAPREHPKAFDVSTGETSWCTGAAVLIRTQAFRELDGFDERIFFMYCEDVDLSWKFWLRGWKCIYVPNAVVQHFTQDILPGKRRTLENYFTFRNSLFLFYRFGSWKQKQVLYNFLLNRFVLGRYSFRSKVLYLFAFASHIRYIPYLFRTRSMWCTERHPWVRLEETSLAD